MSETKGAYYSGQTGDCSGAANPPPYPYTDPSPGAYPYPPGPPAPITVQPTVAPVVSVMMVQPMGPQSTRTTCKSCNHEITTRVESNATTKTHLIALVLCLLGCWCCCCIPYCMDSCMNADHYCPQCNAYLGSYQS